MGRKKIEAIGTCALCRTENVELECSYIIPKFVTRRIIKKSGTGYMRNPFSPNRRLQDGDKQYLLCGDCEDRFSIAETLFADRIFHPYKDRNSQSFVYEEWLNYFIISVNWRNLYLDIVDYNKDGSISEEQLGVLFKKEKTMRDYLMQRRDDIEDIENHMFFFDDIQSAPESISKAQPHSFMRHSTFGYSLISKDYNGYYVVANLSGILIFTLLMKSSMDVWERTKIETSGTYVIGHQHVCSPIASDVLAYMSESRQAAEELSEKQHAKIINDVKKNADRIRECEVFRNKEIDKALYLACREKRKTDYN